jgi:AAA+ superfamily predicted ATPase
MAWSDRMAKMSQQPSTWAVQNQQYLMAAIAEVTTYLQPDAKPALPPEPLQPAAAIEQLTHLFGLSTFERAIILLAAGIELYPGMASLIASSETNEMSSPTFSLALRYLPQPHWSAFTAESPLRYWQLIELGNSSTLVYSPLRINERILHFLLGDRQTDPQLIGLVTPLPQMASLPLTSSQGQLVNEIATLLQQSVSPPLIQICGYDSATKRSLLMAVCREMGWEILHLAAETLPTDLHRLHLIQILWERQAILTGSLLLLDCDGMPESMDGTTHTAQTGAVIRLMETCQYPLVIFSLDRRSVRQRSVFSFDVPLVSAMEQRQLWLQALERGDVDLSEELMPQIDKLVSHFNLSPLAIQSISTQVLPQVRESPSSTSIGTQIWTACLHYARPRLEELAQPIRTQVNWDDLVLPSKEKQILQTIVAQVRQRARVYEQWGFANKGQRGLGISALFAGGSGTGKTLAAEVLANELHLDLYRIDLSSVVSKYIGETEKNLRRIFDAAELGGAILLFDEADALFGKRSEVKDSHDRYANMEVAYLLQRMEAYRGLAILTTNLKTSLDQAFLRRLRFVVQFTFPDISQRAEIWQRVFPQQTPTQNLSYSKLARLSVPGGNIRNIALNATFLAADTNSPVQMQHILLAAQSEYMKLERPLTEEEIKGWN